MADKYQNAYLALMQKKQLEDEAAQKGAPTEEDYSGVRNQQALGALVNSLNKSQALMGSVGGKASEDTGFDNTQFASIAKGGLDDKANKVQSLLKGNQDRYNLGRQNQADLMGVDKFNQDSASQALGDSLSQGKFDLASQANSRDAISDSLKQQNMRQGIQQNNISLNDARQERSYSPETSRIRQQSLQQQKQQMMAQGQNPMSIDAELANLTKADKIFQTAESLRATNPKKADELTKQLDSVINFKKAGQLEGLESNLMKQQTAITTPPSEGFKTLDRESAKDIAGWMGTDREITQTNLARVEEGIRLLENGEATTGRVVGRLNDAFQKEKSINARDSIRSAIQASLRATLGAQFTEKEGERIMNFAYNPTVSEEENIRKARLFQNEMKKITQRKDEKMKYFLENNGSLRGLDMAKFQQENEAQILNLIGSDGSSTPSQPSSQSKPRTVIQNGHTYTLNESTGEYE